MFNMLMSKIAIIIFFSALIIGIIFTFIPLKLKQLNGTKEALVNITRKRIYLYCSLIMLGAIIVLGIFLPPLDNMLYANEIQNANNRIYIQQEYEQDEEEMILNKPFIIRGHVLRHVKLGGTQYAVVSNDCENTTIETESNINFVYVIDNNNELINNTNINIISRAVEIANFNGNETIVFGKYIIEQIQQPMF